MVKEGPSLRRKEELEWLNLEFPMTIADSKPTLRTLCVLANVASEQKTKVLFYVWPLDQDFLEKFGVLDKPALERSIQRIADSTRTENTHSMDLSDLLENKYFHDNFGHCTVEGRRKIAEALAPTVLNILNDIPATMNGS